MKLYNYLFLALTLFGVGFIDGLPQPKTAPKPHSGSGEIPSAPSTDPPHKEKTIIVPKRQKVIKELIHNDDKNSRIIRQSCEVRGEGAELLWSRKCGGRSSRGHTRRTMACSVGPLLLSLNDTPVQLYFCDNELPALLPLACKVRDADADKVMRTVGDADRAEMCAGEGNTCGAGPLQVQMYTTGVEMTFCTHHRILSTSRVNAGTYPTHLPLMNKACEMYTEEGVVMHRACMSRGHCSVGPAAIQWAGATYNVMFCNDTSSLLLNQARKLACRGESDSTPSENLDRPDMCTGAANKCAFGPVKVPLKDGEFVSFTFCTRAGRDSLKRKLPGPHKGNHL